MHYAMAAMGRVEKHALIQFCRDLGKTHYETLNMIKEPQNKDFCKS